MKWCRATKVGLALGALVVASCQAGGSDGVEVRKSGLTQATVFGFETLWTASAGTASLSTVHEQGQYALQLDGFTYTEVTSPSVAVAAGTVTSVGFDIWIPTPPANISCSGALTSS